MKGKIFIVVLLLLVSCRPKVLKDQQSFKSNVPEKRVPERRVSEGRRVNDDIFRVITSNSVKVLRTGRDLQKYAPIKLGETLLMNDGFLLLSNVYGNFFEYSGTDTFQLSHQLDKGMLEMKRQFLCNNQLNLELLFKKEPKELRGYILDNHFGNRCILFQDTEPFINKIEVLKSESKINLSWENTCTEKNSRINYKIYIQNVFDEPLDTFVTETSNHLLDLSIYDTSKNGDLFVITVTETNKAESRPSEMAIQLVDNYYNLKIKSAAKALGSGLGRGIKRNHVYARVYYEHAASLSRQQVYKDFLNNFYLRNNIKIV